MARRRKTACAKGLCGIGWTSQWQDHLFQPSGLTKQYLCIQFGCHTRGLHEACAQCGWPADEHPTVSIGHEQQKED